MTAPAVSIAFFDPARKIYGTARSGTTVLFEDQSPTALAEGPEIETGRRGKVKARLAEHFDLELEPISEEADLGGVVARTCRVTGDVGPARVECLGTMSETRQPPAWEELDALRSISALLDEEHAVLALARRPRGAHGHGEELITARFGTERPEATRRQPEKDKEHDTHSRTPHRTDPAGHSRGSSGAGH